VQLAAENLVLSRGGRTVIDGLSFHLGRGEALMLTGANGAGKTTLLRALAGFLPPAAGSVRLEGVGADQVARERLHFIGHLDGVKAQLTVAENLAFWAEYLGSNETMVEPALARFGLTGLADIPAGYLSAGQKRRLTLARLAAVPRPLWLLDEPTVSLDKAAVTGLASLIDAHVADGGIAVVATHVPIAVAGARQLRLGPAEAAA
jgi:heme exporter protein A